MTLHHNKPITKMKEHHFDELKSKDRINGMNKGLGSARLSVAPELK